MKKLTGLFSQTIFFSLIHSLRSCIFLSHQSVVLMYFSSFKTILHYTHWLHNRLSMFQHLSFYIYIFLSFSAYFFLHFSASFFLHFSASIFFHPSFILLSFAFSFFWFHRTFLSLSIWSTFYLISVSEKIESGSFLYLIVGTMFPEWLSPENKMVVKIVAQHTPEGFVIRKNCGRKQEK